jgi:hypothetical protein
MIDVQELLNRVRAPKGEIVAPGATGQPIPVLREGKLMFVAFHYSWFMREQRSHISGPHDKYTFDAGLNLVQHEEMTDGAKDLGPAGGGPAWNEADSKDLENRYERALEKLIPAFASGMPLPATLTPEREDVRAFYGARVPDAHWPYYRQLGGAWFKWLGM